MKRLITWGLATILVGTALFVAAPQTAEAHRYRAYRAYRPVVAYPAYYGPRRVVRRAYYAPYYYGPVYYGGYYDGCGY